MTLIEGEPMPSPTDILGLHHVSILAGAPAANVAFYTRTLGLRLVKQTVNFDAPSAYHLYYGDRVGSPGSLVTFFPEASNRPGEVGTGEVGATHLSVPRGTLEDWAKRLPDSIRDGDRLAFQDHDGTRLSLEEVDAPGDGILGLRAVTVVVADLAPTTQFFVETLGLTIVGNEAGARSFATAGGQPAIVELIAAPDAPPARQGWGSVHHVALRVADDAAQSRVRAAILAAGLHPTEQRDRNYFRSVYTREPGGTIIEIATDGPGFAVDESVESLGTKLMLPSQFEPQRAAIESRLPPLT